MHIITVGADQPSTGADGDVIVHRVIDVADRFRSLGCLVHSYIVARKIMSLRCSFDIVQASEWSGEVFWYSRRPTFPLISRLATPSFLVERLNSSGGHSVPRIVNYMERAQVKNSAGVISSTKALAEVVCDAWGIPSPRVRIIPNSLDIDWIRSFRDVPPKLDFWRRDFLLYYGRLEERKGVHVLADALPGVLKKHPGLRAVFVGADNRYGRQSMRQHIENKCAAFRDRLVFVDSLPQAQLFPIVARAKLVVLPSLWEAFGFVCLEAMSLGRAVIASSGSGFEEIIEDGISGYLVQPGNPASLEAKILWCLEHEEDIERVGRRAEVRADHFRVDNVVLSLIDYYGSVLRGMKTSAVPAWSATDK